MDAIASQLNAAWLKIYFKLMEMFTEIKRGIIFIFILQPLTSFPFIPLSHSLLYKLNQLFKLNLYPSDGTVSKTELPSV
jgi:hypothetical protein